MSEKSELEYLLEALEHTEPPGAYVVTLLIESVERAIELRKQDLAKGVDNGDVQGLRGGYQYECDTRKDNTPKGGGDVTNRDRALRHEVVKVADNRLLEMQQQAVAHEGITDNPVYHWHWVAAINELIALRARYDALLAERDAARAELKAVLYAATFPLSGAYGPSATCKHGEHPFNCQFCDPRNAFLDRVGKQP